MGKFFTGLFKVAKGLGIFGGAAATVTGAAVVADTAAGTGYTETVAKDFFETVGRAQTEAGQEAGWHGFYSMINQLGSFIESIFGKNGISDGLQSWSEKNMEKKEGLPTVSERLEGTVQTLVEETVPYASAVREFREGDYTTAAHDIAADTGGLAAAWAGTSMGASIGGTIGLAFGGVGAAPGAVIGGVIGGIAGWTAGTGIVNGIWNYFQAPAPEPTRQAVLENMNGQFDDAVNNRVAEAKRPGLVMGQTMDYAPA